jgi:hypothetical protein
MSFSIDAIDVSLELRCTFLKDLDLPDLKGNFTTTRIKLLEAEISYPTFCGACSSEISPR